jgi:phosphoenolpyruvate synthase/pyruvate phosphate dikinase
MHYWASPTRCFALTAHAYREALAAADAVNKLRRLLSHLDHHNVVLLAKCAAAAWNLAMSSG